MHRRLAGARDVDEGTGRRGVGSGQARAGKALDPSTAGVVPATATGRQQRDPACRAGRRAYMGLRARWGWGGVPEQEGHLILKWHPLQGFQASNLLPMNG